MTRLSILVAIVGLAGCAARPEPGLVLTRTVLLTREILVPLPAQPPPPLAARPAPRPACTRSVGPSPAYPDRDQALRDAAGIYEQVQLLLAGRMLRIERERQLASALRACTSAGAGRP